TQPRKRTHLARSPSFRLGPAAAGLLQERPPAAPPRPAPAPARRPSNLSASECAGAVAGGLFSLPACGVLAYQRPKHLDQLTRLIRLSEKKPTLRQVLIA